MLKISQTFGLTAALIAASATPVFAQAVQEPKLNIVTPRDGITIYGDKVPVLLSVDNFNLTDFKANLNPVAGQGHILLWLDIQNPTADSATKVIEDNYTFNDVPAGDHTLKAELVGNDNSPLSPDQSVTVRFKSAPVGSPSPAPQPAFDKQTAAVILVVVALVIVAAWWYTRDDEDDVEKLSAPKSAPKKKTPPAGGKKKKPAARRRK